MKLVFATNNIHKIKEVRAILNEGIQLLTLSDIDCSDELPETAATFEGNALQKARYVYDKFGINCFADDSGLEVDALNGNPGIYSARYAGTHNNIDNMTKLLLELKDETNRKAQFISVIVSIIDGEQKSFEGIIRGSITNQAKGATGFGYDPVFIPEGDSRTFAEMKPAEKNLISHRSLALKKFSAYLASLIYFTNK